MVLVSDIATFPIGFRVYVPNPAMSAWRMYTLRWLVEVFIQDWKAHCG
jgi:hypothetical protein